MFLKVLRTLGGLICFAITVFLIASIPSSLSSTTINQFLIDSKIDKLIFALSYIGMAGLYATWGIGLIKKLKVNQIFIPTIAFVSLFIFFMGYAAFGCPW